MKKRNIIYNTIVLIILYIIGLSTNTIIPKYIAENNIHDFGLNEIFNTAVYIPIVFLLTDLFFKDQSKNHFFYISLLFILLTSHEIMQFFIPKLGVFDFRDLLGYLIGVLLTIFLLKHKKKYVQEDY